METSATPLALLAEASSVMTAAPSALLAETSSVPEASSIAALAGPVVVSTERLAGVTATADLLPQALTRMLEQHARIKAAEADLRAATAALAKTRGGFFPDLKITSDTGRESINNPGETPNTDLSMRHTNFSVNQLLWDFGKTSAETAKAAIAVQQAENSVQLAKQDLLLEGMSAYINLLRAYVTTEFAQQSVDNIQKQAGLEESRVDLGSGFPTDVLQAKSQLAGAQARHSRAKGGLVSAMNRYRSVFEADPPRREDVRPLRMPQDRFPSSLEEALRLTRERNLQLRNAELGRTSADLEIDRVKADSLAPKLNLVSEAKFSRNDTGVAGNKEDKLVKMELSYAFNAGLAGIDALHTAREQKLAVASRFQDTATTVEEQARNAWQSLITARENADHLANQVRIAAEFLRLAQEERLQGRRSLIDVLSGETTVINAQSDAAAADADVAIAALTILKTIGQLAMDSVQ
ncbi:MAG: TolC family protein [Magnetococcales bacterium]|nr:TolC family protein [Magnetococcales bacterium]